MPLRVVAPISVNGFRRRIDGARVHALAEYDVDAEILHRRIDELLDDARHAMDFVDEQDRAFLDVGQKRQQVGRLRQGGAAGHLDRRAQFVGQHGGEGRLAQSGRAVEQDVRQRLLEFLAGVEDDAQAAARRLSGRSPRAASAAAARTSRCRDSRRRFACTMA